MLIMRAIVLLAGYPSLLLLVIRHVVLAGILFMLSSHLISLFPLGLLVRTILRR